VVQSEQKGIFRLGQCDLHIEDRQKTLEFLLCHESDIHFASADQRLVEQIISLWHAKGIALYVGPGPKEVHFQEIGNA
jgi:hypothetical protein